MANFPATQNPQQYYSVSFDASTSTGESQELSYNASFLQIENRTCESLYVSVGSTTPSTGGYDLTTGEKLTIQPGGTRVRDLSVARNTTTTDLAGGLKVLGLN